VARREPFDLTAIPDLTQPHAQRRKVRQQGEKRAPTAATRAANKTLSTMMANIDKL